MVMSDTPIFDQLQENWTQLYAEDVLARKVEADINGAGEISDNGTGSGAGTAATEVDEPASPVDDGHDAAGALGEGDTLDE